MTAADRRLSGPLFVMIGELVQLNGHLKRLFAPAIAESGLSPIAHLVLTMVSDSETPLTVPHLGRMLGHPRQVIQRVVNELAEAGLIETTSNPSHKRARLIALSEAGARFKQASDARMTAVARALLAHVDEQRCARLAGDLAHVRRGIDDYLAKKDG